MRSPGLLTSMMFHHFAGEVSRRDFYIVVKTPSNPIYRFGNFLYFGQAPGPGALEAWRALFRAEFKDLPDVKHLTFQWDDAAGVTDEFCAAGYELEQSVVLEASAVRPPPKYHAGVAVRKLAGDADWRAATELAIFCRPADAPEAEYRDYKQRQMASYRAMAAQGLGHWFGAFLDGQLVADLGIFVDGGVGRFQQVEAHPGFWRRGICGTLVYESARYALTQMGARTLVMVADEHYHAAKIYESVGFTPSWREYAACWWDRARS